MVLHGLKLPTKPGLLADVLMEGKNEVVRREDRAMAARENMDLVKQTKKLYSFERILRLARRKSE
jgi:hypothetical protein